MENNTVQEAPNQNQTKTQNQNQTKNQSQNQNNTDIIVIITLLIVISSIVTVCYYFYVKRKKEKARMETIDLGTIEEDPMIDLWDRKFPQSTVKAWKDISIERELGSGQFGKVYKGFLNSNYTR